MDTYRGHETEVLNGLQVYADTKEPTFVNIRPWCGHCGKDDTPEGHDGCVETLDESIVMNACCGHDEPKFAYVQFWPIRFLRLRLWRFRIFQFPLWARQRISGEEAIEFIETGNRAR